jgi:[ribosomal protein S5]-alanine N-acetyltransferase
MQFELVFDKHQRILADWSKFSRLEERTCRPIINGKRVTPDNDLVTFVFSSTIDGINQPIGRFDYFDLNVRNRSAEFGYTVNPKFRRLGFGRKMLITAINYLFLNINLNKLYCQTAAFNIASIKLLEKLNFHQDAVLREHHELDGIFWDDLIYSILQREWKLFNL